MQKWPSLCIHDNTELQSVKPQIEVKAFATESTKHRKEMKCFLMGAKMLKRGANVSPGQHTIDEMQVDGFMTRQKSKFHDHKRQNYSHRSILDLWTIFKKTYF